MAYWLLKTEPDECSIDDLAAQPKKSVAWEGVRNYQARNFLRQMRIGDELLIYHSSCKLIGIAGVAKVSKSVYPDPAQFNPNSPYFDSKSPQELPRWDAIDVVFVRKFAQLVSLDEIKLNPVLADLALVKKGNRLSVMPVEENEWNSIISATN